MGVAIAIVSGFGVALSLLGRNTNSLVGMSRQTKAHGGVWRVEGRTEALNGETGLYACSFMGLARALFGVYALRCMPKWSCGIERCLFGMVVQMPFGWSRRVCWTMWDGHGVIVRQESPMERVVQGSDCIRQATG